MRVFRIHPDTRQVARLGQWEDALRFLWNLALEQRHIGLARSHDERVFPTAFDQINDLTELRAALPCESLGSACGRGYP